ncbi:fimbrial protein [Basilea psittacipulmonis]|uniref:Fimbrial-type adhesion domain-containing protein n=1 Tax=Basilea psittacipulmonis DSM 24701 TaxID=1072685 RepID=A0A077DAR1_9BURK|nr:fimbrial protein [Basilea psittacipulmonis]AIL31990.1 hypothetical protein IX83_00420 [Basilea psittacipulmonis DSM 24701]
MKKLLLTSAILAGLSAQVAFAANSGKVTFNGKVVDTTCIIKSDDENKVVSLPSVPSSELTTAGNTTGDTGFELIITGCSTGDSVTAGGIQWKLDNNVDAATGTLINQASTSPKASNVNIQLVNEDGSAIKVGDANATASINYKNLDKSSTSAETKIPFSARYYATGQATAGDVQAIANFSVVYK